ncbi:LysR family transcriptional regulator [Methylobacterium platani]|uniref:HTH lysR-type domain-containing protein n=1 Tax=Methylobacterium platani JCM 14648 TaxID=1295136 RepID=A0ABR5H4E9_9HYPH|nr:LysR family transcriptional regulator [Methylobacterium platani]KMO18466.1 hypothetical protein SQ03_10390 [Methylobacterium platani JCM 14648]
MRSRNTQAIPALADRLRLRQLRLVTALGEQGTLRRAAAALNVTQPTATKMLAECEAIFGVALYERRPRGLHATPAGREVLGLAQRVMAECGRSAAALATLEHGGGELVVGAILGATPDFIVQAVLDVKTQWPHLVVRLRGESSDQVLAMLENRTVDIAVGRFSKPTQHNLFRYEPLGDEALCVVARAGHPLLRARDLRLGDLTEQRWVLQSIETPARQILEAEFGKAGAATPGDMIEANSILTIVQLLQRSDAVAMLSEPMVRDHVASGLLGQLPVAIGARLSDFGLLTRRGETLTGVAAQFADRLRESARTGVRP